MTSAGTYTLIVGLEAPARVAFGALGERDLPAGWYAYTGSALGPGGFARIERHRAVAAGENDARHWHVDYLLGRPESRVAAAVRSPGADVECRVARDAGEALETVAGVGATDCDCPSHLAYAADRSALRGTVEAAHGRHAADPTTERFK